MHQRIRVVSCAPIMLGLVMALVAVPTSQAEMELAPPPQADFEGAAPEVQAPPPPDYEPAQAEMAPPPPADYEQAQPEVARPGPADYEQAAPEVDGGTDLDQSDDEQ